MANQTISDSQTQMNDNQANGQATASGVPAGKVPALHVSTAAFDTVLASAGDKPVLVDFFATWCGPCKMIAPVIEELATEYNGRAVIAKVDVDNERELAQRFGVMSIPTLMVFKNGQEVAKKVGFVPKSALTELLDTNLAA